MSRPIRRPKACLALHPVLCEAMLQPHLIARLAELTELLDEEPLSRFDDPRADALLADAEVLLTAWGCPPLDVTTLERAPQLRLVAHASGTVKNHVTEACFDRGLVVTSAAAANAMPVAEYTLAAILWSNKRVFQAARRYASVRGMRFWPREFPGIGNHRKTVGLVGASYVGRRVLELLAPFDFELLLADPTLDGAEARALGAELVELDELLARSDVTSLHAPLLPTTRGLVDARRLALMPDGATLVNTARGAIVDGPALEAELVSGRLHAVIDTTDPEVLPPESPLYALENVLLTPHLAGSMGSETERMFELALGEIERWARGDALMHPIDRADWDRIA